MPVQAKQKYSVDELKEMFSYNAETGVVSWAKISKQSSMVVGQRAGSVKANGYIRIQIGKNMIQAHRVAWALHYGVWPTGSIDHINRNRADNRISNLRECSHAENMMNRGASYNNKTGLKGVSRQKGGYRASIGVGGKNIKLGSYGTPEQAFFAYVEAAKHYHGGFASF